MVALRERLRELERERRELVQTIAGNGSGFAVNDARQEGFEVLLKELEACVEEVESLGIVVKDVDLGLVDFPAPQRRARSPLLARRRGAGRVLARPRGGVRGAETGRLGRRGRRMSEFWQRLAIAAVVIAVAALVARVVDRGIARRDLAPEAATRYRVLRRSIWITIVFVGVFSALLVIPQVQTIAGGILASSAVLGLVIGFASQRTIGNFVAGILIAFTQPLRLGDEVEVQGASGIVEEIGLTYTWIRTRDNDRYVVPNEKLASDTIRNSTIRSPGTLAEVTVQVPVTADLRAVVAALAQESDDVYVTELAAEDVTITVRRTIADDGVAERAASDLRLEVHDRLRAAGAVS